MTSSKRAGKFWSIETVYGHKRTVIGRGPGDRHYAFTTDSSNAAEDCANLSFGCLMEQGEWSKGVEAWGDVKDAPSYLLERAAEALDATPEQVWFFAVWRNEFNLDE